MPEKLGQFRRASVLVALGKMRQFAIRVTSTINIFRPHVLCIVSRRITHVRKILFIFHTFLSDSKGHSPNSLHLWMALGSAEITCQAVPKIFVFSAPNVHYAPTCKVSVSRTLEAYNEGCSFLLLRPTARICRSQSYQTVVHIFCMDGPSCQILRELFL